MFPIDNGLRDKALVLSFSLFMSAAQLSTSHHLWVSGFRLVESDRVFHLFYEVMISGGSLTLKGPRNCMPVVHCVCELSFMEKD